MFRKKKKKYDIITQLNKMNGVGNKMKTWSKQMRLNFGGMIMPPLDFIVISNIFSEGNDYKSTFESLAKMLLPLITNLISSIFSKMANQYDDLVEDEMNCSDTYVNDNYNLMTLKLRKSGHNIFICSIIDWIIVGLNALALIYKCVIDYCLNKKEKEKDSIIIKKYKYKIQKLNENLLEAQKKLIEEE